MQKTWLSRVVSLLTATFIMTVFVHIGNLIAGNLVRKKLLENLELTKVLDYIKESGVKIQDIRLASENIPTYPDFFIFILFLILFVLGIHSMSTKITAKILKL